MNAVATDVWTAIAAIATFLAVVVALYVQLALPWWKRPKLKLEAYDPSPSAGDAARVSLADRAHHAPYETGWFRLRVANEGRGTAASNAQVTVLAVRPEQGAPGYSVIPTRSLAWSDVASDRVDLPAGVTRHVDLLSLGPPSGDLHMAADRVQDASRRMRLELWPRDRTDSRAFLKSGTYLVSLVLTAEGTRPTKWRLRVTFDVGDGDTIKEFLKRSEAVSIDVASAG